MLQPTLGDLFLLVGIVGLILLSAKLVGLVLSALLALIGEILSLILRLVLDLRARADIALRIVDLRARTELIVRVLLDGELTLLTRTGVRNARFEHRRLGSVGRAPTTLSHKFIVRCSVVDLAHTLLVWTSGVGSLGGTVSEEVATDEANIGEEPAGLAVGEDEVKEGAKVGDGLVAIALGLVLVKRGGTLSCVLPLRLRLVERGCEVGGAGVPEELLEEFVVVFVETWGGMWLRRDLTKETSTIRRRHGCAERS